MPDTRFILLLMKTFRLEIITLEKKTFDEAVDSVNIPTLMGEIGVLAGHIPLVASLSIGEIKIKKGGDFFSLATSGGFARIHPDRVTLLTDAAEHAEEIDEKRAQAAKARAQETMQKAGLPAPEYALAAAALRRATLRLKVARKKRKTGRILHPETEV